jgi:hypothetical protein
VSSKSKVFEVFFRQLILSFPVPKIAAVAALIKAQSVLFAYFVDRMYQYVNKVIISNLYIIIPLVYYEVGSMCSNIMQYGQ